MTKLKLPSPEIIFEKAYDAIFAKTQKTSKLSKKRVTEVEERICSITKSIFKLIGHQLEVNKEAGAAEVIFVAQTKLLTENLEEIIKTNRHKVEQMLGLVYKLSVALKKTYK